MWKVILFVIKKQYSFEAWKLYSLKSVDPFLSFFPGSQSDKSDSWDSFSDNVVDKLNESVRVWKLPFGRLYPLRAVYTLMQAQAGLSSETVGR